MPLSAIQAMLMAAIYGYGGLAIITCVKRAKYFHRWEDSFWFCSLFVYCLLGILLLVVPE